MAAKGAIEKFVTIIVVGLVLIVFVPVFAFLHGACLWIAWTWAGIGARYFTFLPTEWQVISFVDCCWIGWLASAIKSTIGMVKTNSD